MTRNNDYGASHNFGAKVKKVLNEQRRHGHAEIRISRTVYIKEVHFRKIIFYAEGEELNISQAFDNVLQCGFAYQELMKVQDREKEKMRCKKELSTNTNDDYGPKPIDSNLSIVREN